ncbi:MAG: phosphomannomutase [Acidobacteria bacterium]|uniref:Phosphomannomutase n=1 Tax=Candidatus Polarisedimenticola svalbardensis TaxID=2886004 RepID=A0A8J6XTS3_9BACT|nr:phosphomannomutase [Candidatus Polarisedimenticola svalbardensis]
MSSNRDRLACFKAYDVRGRIPDELNAELAYKIGRAYALFLNPKQVVVGQDIRLSSPEISAAVCEGLLDSGVDVVHIGQGGTEHVYFATFHLGLDGGVMVTASHNPQDYNGLKLVREQARPISSDTGLNDIEQMILDGLPALEGSRGSMTSADIHEAYTQHILEYVDLPSLKPLKVVVNAGNGGAGSTIDRLEPHLPFEFTKVHHDPDGTFPHGIPNPLLPDNRQATADAVVRVGADAGIAWDGDFDRCFLFDETGGFIEGYYIVGLLAETVLARNPGAKIVHDPRLTWNTVEMVRAAGGKDVQSKSGHAFIKEVMRREDAAYGGEMSAHHFFREFSYCDSGMIPWLMVLEIMSMKGLPLSKLVGERMERFPASGEINRRLDNPDGAIARIRERYAASALLVDETDGIGFDFPDWRFNLRKSNTEPLIRLNVESRGDLGLMEAKTAEVLAILEEA